MAKTASGNRRRLVSPCGRGLVAAVLLPLFMMTSCWPFRPVPAPTEKIGTARVSVVAVIPWEEIRTKLAPKFNLPNGDAALAKVAPIVQSESSSFSRTLSIVAAASVAGDTPEAKFAAVKDVAESAAGSDGGTTLTHVSPMSQYALATALYREVQLLNEAVAYFETQEREVFLVATDIALMPRRQANVDAEVLVSFLRPAPSSTNDVCLDQKQRSFLTTIEKTRQEGSDRSELEGGGIDVVPIISQDDVELSQHAQAVQDAVQLAFALSVLGSVKKTPAEILTSLGFSTEEISRTLGRDINSLQVVGRGSRESFVARFGAALTVEPSHTLFPQTRHVYSLLIVPRRLLPDLWREGTRSTLHAVSTVRFLEESGDEHLNGSQQDVGGVPAQVEDVITQVLADVGDEGCVNNIRRCKADLWRRYQSGMDLGPLLAAACGRESASQQLFSYVAPLRHEFARLSASSASSWSPVFLPKPVVDELDAYGGAVVSLVSGDNITLDVAGKRLITERSRWIAEEPKSGHRVHPRAVSQVGVNGDIFQVSIPAEPFCPKDGGACSPGFLRYGRHYRIDENGFWCADKHQGDGGNAGDDIPKCIQQISPFAGRVFDGPNENYETVAFQPIRGGTQAPKAEVKLTVTNAPIASEANGNAFAIVELTLPSDEFKANTQVLLRVSGASAVLVDEKGNPVMERSITVPEAGKAYRAELRLSSVIPGQRLTIQAVDGKGKLLKVAEEVMVARENPGNYRKSDD